MSREIRIPHDTIANSQTLTPEMERIFKEQGLDLHRHEVEKLEDDFGTKERVLRVKNTKYFIQGGSQ
jgi:hypothetical protein